MSTKTEKTFCRYCHAYCPMEVDLDGAEVKAVRPDTSNDMYGGYTCIKGRQLVEQMYQSERLTAPQKNTADGFCDNRQPTGAGRDRRAAASHHRRARPAGGGHL